MTYRSRALSALTVTCTLFIGVSGAHAQDSAASGATKGALLLPVETVKKGDGKLVAAFDDVIAMMKGLNSRLKKVKGCAARVRTFEKWAQSNQDRASRLSYRVQHLAARLNYAWTADEKARMTQHETAYEDLVKLLMAVCSEDSPEMARVGELDIELRHTFHRSPQSPPLGDGRCAQLKEVRDRVMLAPETLVGERKPDGSHVAALSIDGFGCFVNAAEWRKGGKDFIVACIALSRTKARAEFLNTLARECLERDLGTWRYKKTEATPTSVVLKAKGHAVGGHVVKEQEGRYVLSIIRPR
jgi:hypothetical protein